MSRKKRKKLFVFPKDWGGSSEGVTVQEGEYISKLLNSRNGLLTYLTLFDGTVIKALSFGMGRDFGDLFDHVNVNFYPFAQGLESDFVYTSQIVEISNEDGAVLFRAAKQTDAVDTKE